MWVGGAASAIAFADTGSAANDDSVGRASEASAGDDDTARRPGAAGQAGRDDTESDDQDSRNEDGPDNELNDGLGDQRDDKDPEDREDPEDPQDGEAPEAIEDTEDPADTGDSEGAGDPADGSEEFDGTDGTGEDGQSCCDDGDDECGGWPWPWPWPEPDPLEPVTDVSTGDGPGGFIPAGPPAFRPPVPATQVPPELLPIEPSKPSVIRAPGSSGCVSTSSALQASRGIQAVSWSVHNPSRICPKRDGGIVAKSCATARSLTRSPSSGFARFHVRLSAGSSVVLAACSM